MSRMRRTNFAFRQFELWSLMLLDLTCLGISLLCAFWLRFESGHLGPPAPMEALPTPHSIDVLRPLVTASASRLIYLRTGLAMLPLWLILFKYFNLYEERRTKNNANELYNVCRAVTLGTLILFAATFFYRGFSYSRLISVFFWGLDIFFTGAFRLAFRRLTRWLRRMGYDRRSVVIVGTGEVARILCRDLGRHPGLGYRMHGFLLDGSEATAHSVVEGFPVLGRLTDLHGLIGRLGVADVFVGNPSLDHDSIMNLIADCDGLGVRFKIVSDAFEVITHRQVNIETINGIPILEFNEGYFPWWRSALKRAIDLVGAIVGFVLTLPLCLSAALLIRLTSRGPVLFVQERIGKDGQPFKLYKFRTMRHDTPIYAPAPDHPDDPRVTALGRRLRRFSLDELPQLINVLLGSMSLVGPRPEMAFHVNQYNRWQRKRLSVKPGLTGLWQIHGRSDIPLHKNLEYDLYYVRNQSLFLDYRIMLKTIFVVLFGRGAY